MNPTDPLSQLRDIHLPDPVSWWPLAPGWWLVITLGLLALALLLWLGLRYWRKNAYRRSALNLLDQQFNQWQKNRDNLEFLQAANAIVKRAAISRFPRRDVAQLSGSAWAEFLNSTSGKKKSADFAESPLVADLYKPHSVDADIETLHQQLQCWLRAHGVES